MSLKNFLEYKTALYISLVTFLSFGCVFAFRTPFTVGQYGGMSTFAGLKFKDALIIAHVLGYASSKFAGIKLISEMKRNGRGKVLFVLVLMSWLALLFFALTPAPWSILFLFVNGFPLGFAWGIIYSYVEGRKMTDFIASALAVSMIYSSGVAKMIASFISIHYHVSDCWLGFFTGTVFIIPIAILCYLLGRIPPPTVEDQQLRIKREPMKRKERWIFLKEYGPGILVLILIYIFLSVFRDIRDNYAAEMLREFGLGNNSAALSYTELPTTIIVFLVIALMVMIRNNYKAFLLNHVIVIIGFVISGMSSWLFLEAFISPILWMTLMGLGLYLAYAPYNSVLFDRLIGSFKITGNVGFLIYLSDSFGYFFSVGIIVIKTCFSLHVKWSVFYSRGAVCLSIIGIILCLISMRYFKVKYASSKV